MKQIRFSGPALAIVVIASISLLAPMPVLAAGAESAAQAETAKKRKRRSVFARDKVGSVPDGWKVAETAGTGTPATWEVIRDKSAPGGPKAVAVTASKNKGRTFNLLIAQDKEFADVFVRVAVKAVAGKEDQGGGPIWRAKDADNYYVARWNPLEDNFRVYFVKDGKRTQIATADVKTDPKAWHTITITHRGSRIVARLDGERLIRVEDETFTEAGKVGLWSKADAQTAFSDFRAREVKTGDKAGDAKPSKREGKTRKK